MLTYNEHVRSRKSNDTTPVVAPVNAQEHGGAPSVDPVIEGLRDGCV